MNTLQKCIRTPMRIADGLDNDCDGRIDEEVCYSDTVGEFGSDYRDLCYKY